MSGYGSPSLVKMEASSRRGRRPKRHFSLSRILGDPFALATISISIVCDECCQDLFPHLLANRSTACLAHSLCFWYRQQSQRFRKTWVSQLRLVDNSLLLPLYYWCHRSSCFRRHCELFWSGMLDRAPWPGCVLLTDIRLPLS